MAAGMAAQAERAKQHIHTRGTRVCVYWPGLGGALKRQQHATVHITPVVEECTAFLCDWPRIRPGFWCFFGWRRFVCVSLIGRASFQQPRTYREKLKCSVCEDRLYAGTVALGSVLLTAVVCVFHSHSFRCAATGRIRQQLARINLFKSIDLIDCLFGKCIVLTGVSKDGGEHYRMNVTWCSSVFAVSTGIIGEISIDF